MDDSVFLTTPIEIWSRIFSHAVSNDAEADKNIHWLHALLLLHSRTLGTIQNLLYKQLITIKDEKQAYQFMKSVTGPHREYAGSVKRLRLAGVPMQWPFGTFMLGSTTPHESDNEEETKPSTPVRMSMINYGEQPDLHRLCSSLTNLDDACPNIENLALSKIVYRMDLLSGVNENVKHLKLNDTLIMSDEVHNTFPNLHTLDATDIYTGNTVQPIVYFPKLERLYFNCSLPHPAPSRTIRLSSFQQNAHQVKELRLGRLVCAAFFQDVLENPDHSLEHFTNLETIEILADVYRRQSNMVLPILNTLPAELPYLKSLKINIDSVWTRKTIHKFAETMDVLLDEMHLRLTSPLSVLEDPHNQIKGHSFDNVESITLPHEFEPVVSDIFKSDTEHLQHADATEPRLVFSGTRLFFEAVKELHIRLIYA